MTATAAKVIHPPNYTQVPNYIMDNLDKFSSQSELKVVLAVARKTFGWRKDRDVISISQLVSMTGMSRQSVVDGVEAAVANGWIERIEAGQSFSYTVLVQKVDQSDSPTSPETRPVPVQKVDQQLVQKLDTQKKQLNKDTDSAKEPRQRDLLFDAVVEVCQADAKLQGASIGKVVTALRAAGYGPADVQAFGADWWSWSERTKAPSLWKLQAGISQVKNAAKRPANIPKPTGGGPWGARPSLATGSRK